jgi:inosine triphosphate pyrophosphatase
MKKPELVFVTGNLNKLREAQAILSEFNIINHKLDLPELQGEPEDIAREKAKIAFKQIAKPCFIEDDSLGFKAWNWLPGPYIKDFTLKIGVENIPSLLEGHDNSAKISCTIAYAKSESDIKIIRADIFGKIVSSAGDFGFDFDKIFMLDGDNIRFSQMSEEEKNKKSHRHKALEMFKNYLLK